MLDLPAAPPWPARPGDADPAPCRAAGVPLTGRELAVLWGSVFALLVVFTGLAHTFGASRAFWSGDCVARFAMIQNWLAHGSLTRVPYPNAAWDPTGRLYPLAFYAVPTPRGLCLDYPPLFPLLSGLAYRALGFGGLTVLPTLAALGTVLVTYATARRLGLRAAPLLPAALGLATPLPIYAASFWDHTLLMLVAAAAGYGLLRAAQAGRDRRRRRAAVLAGAVLGAGLWVHELSLMLLLAVALGGLWARETRRMVPALAVGAAPFAAAWCLGNWLCYGLVTSPHVVSSLVTNLGSAYGFYEPVNPARFAHRALLQLVGTDALDRWGVLLLLLLAGLFLLTRAAGAGRPGGRLAALGLCLGAAACAARLAPAGLPSSGLFAVTPLLVPALTAPGFGGRAGWRWGNHGGPRAEEAGDAVFVTWLGRACGLFGLIVLVDPVVPGMDWGSRYLLTMLPLLVLLAAWALERAYADTRRPGRVGVLLTAAALLAVSGASQLRGAAAVRGNLGYCRDLGAAVAGLGDTLLVTDQFWLADEAAPGPVLRPDVLVRTAEDRLVLRDALRRRGTDRFAFMGSAACLALLTRALADGPAPFVPTDEWAAMGRRVARFARRPAAPQSVRRRVLALYYPWYATPAVSGRWEHWAAPAEHPVTGAPRGGPYDSADPAVIARHLAQARAAGIDTLVCSWWGPGTPSDRALRRLLARAPRYGLTVAVQWERLAAPPAVPGPLAEAREAPARQAALSELSYLLATFGARPGYLRQNGRPVVFVYGSVCRALTPGGWAAVLARADARRGPGVFAVGHGLGAEDALLWDGTYALGLTPTDARQGLAASARAERAVYPTFSAAARDLRRVSVETLCPGTAAAGGGPVGGAYGAAWAQALRDRPDWVLVNSFNEWDNGTAIEPSSASGGRYLALTRACAARFRVGRGG